MPKNTTNSADRKKFICPECGVTLSSHYNLKIHLETRCSTEKNHICDICQARFLTIHSLKTHIKSLHQDDKKFVCSSCGKSFAAKGQLTVHERIHSREKPFKCQICGKAFSHRETLVTHSTVHTKIKPYACENCHQTFSCVGNLIKHRKVRPTSCGLPIYTNKKICKRAGVKCAKRVVPEIVVDATASIDTSENEIIAIEIHGDEQDDEEHEYVVLEDNQSQIDFLRKEMEVLDFMCFEVRNPQEADSVQEIIEEEPDMIVEELEEVADDDNIIEETFEEISPNESKTEGEDEEISDYIAIKNDTYKCKLCPKIYTKRNISINHLRKEHQIILNCFNYDTANRYRKPQKSQKWKCKFCPKKYTSAKMVERHESLHGEDGRLIHKCVCCSNYFSSIEELEGHLYATHADRLICNIADCKKKFDHPEKLMHHKKYSHSGKKQQAKKYLFVCPICGRNFNTKVALSDHERSDCGKNPIYKCDYCNKNYQSAGNLKIHMSIHTLELNFSCTHCPKKFRTKGQLTVHNRRHLNIKPFKCKYPDCKAEFAHRESLLTHNTIHTGIKRFECEKCSAQFSCISNLLAHRRSRRKDCSDTRICKVKNAESSLKNI